MQLPLPQSSTMMIVVGLNAAYQKRFVLPDESSLVPGQVHRAASLSTGVGGKGQNVFLALTQCLEQHKTRSDDSVVCAQFLGRGPEGDAVADLLHNGSLTVRTQAPLRTCTSIVARDATTELIEPSGEISTEEWNELLQRLGEGSGSTPVSHVAFMGSVPPGCPSTAYADIYDRLVQNSAGDDDAQPLRCIIDSVVGLDTLLPRLTTSTLAILKINRDELLRLANRNPDEDSLLDAIQNLPAYYQEKLKAIAITDGSQPAHIWYEKQLYQIPIPKLQSTSPLYPIGAGDAVAAGCLAAWKKNDDPVEAFRYGLACGSASCLLEDNSMFSLDQVETLLQEMGSPSLVSSGVQQ